MKIIEDQTTQGVCKPIFDFCFIDGAHTWEIDGLAFFLVEKLLKPGGWILFDDLFWTYENVTNPGHAEVAEIVQKMPGEQRTTAQVSKVFSLLVCQHEKFENIRINSGWGWAQKKELQGETTRNSHNLVDEVYLQQIGIKRHISVFVKKIKKRILSW